MDWYNLGRHFGQMLLPLLFVWLLFQSCAVFAQVDLDQLDRIDRAELDLVEAASVEWTPAEAALLLDSDVSSRDPLHFWKKRRFCLNEGAYAVIALGTTAVVRDHDWNHMPGLVFDLSWLRSARAVAVAPGGGVVAWHVFTMDNPECLHIGINGRIANGGGARVYRLHLLEPGED